MFREWWTRRKLNSDNPDARLAAVAALAQSDAPGADALLIEALGDRAERVRERAAYALAERGAEEAIPAIAARLRREHWLTQKSFAQALIRLGWDPQTDPERALLAVALEDWDRAAQAGGDAIPLLLDRLKFYRQFMEEDQAPARREFVPDYPAMILGVVRALGQIGSAGTVRALLPLLADPPPSLREAGVPEAARASLAAMGLGARPALRDTIFGSQDPRWLRAGLGVLIEMGWQPKPADAGLLVRAIQDEAARDEHLAGFAVAALDDLLGDSAADIPAADLAALVKLADSAETARLRSLAQAELARRERPRQ